MTHDDDVVGQFRARLRKPEVVTEVAYTGSLQGAYASYSPKTQKARGVKVLATTKILSMPGTAFVLDTAKPNWPGLLKNMGISDLDHFKVFARPCPLTPQHGFVDSRVCTSVAELQTTWEAARKADPQAEMLLCLPVDANWNAIVTPTMVIVGPGHDGATSGSLTISMPLNGQYSKRWKQLSLDAGIPATDVPFLELVQAGGTPPKWYGTQIRGGPAVPFAVDYIPEAMTVEHVCLATGDLIEWQKHVAAFLPNTVAYHPNGSLGTHYGVHCILHKVPIITSYEPVVGQTLTATDPQPPWDVDALRTGIVAASLVPLLELYDGRREAAVYQLLCGLHHANVLRGPHSFWLGAACGFMHRLGVAAALGEWRHTAAKVKKPNPMANLQRAQVYQLALSDVFPSRKHLPAAMMDFATLQWGSGFGGKKWASCSASIVKLDQALRQVFVERSPEAVTNLISSLNVAVNQAHNNGWWMNKFCGAAAFDYAASYDLIVPIKQLPIMTELIKVMYLQRPRLEQTLNRWLLSGALAGVGGDVTALLNPDGTKGPAPVLENNKKALSDLVNQLTAPPKPLTAAPVLTAAQARCTLGGYGNQIHFQAKLKLECPDYLTVDYTFDSSGEAEAKLALIQADALEADGAEHTSFAGSETVYYPVKLVEGTLVGKVVQYQVWTLEDTPVGCTISFGLHNVQSHLAQAAALNLGMVNTAALADSILSTSPATLTPEEAKGEDDEPADDDDGDEDS